MVHQKSKFGCNFALVASALLLLLLPLLAAPHWPLLDAPAHEARLAILHDIASSERTTPFYEFDTLFLPNIAFDVIGFVMTLVVSPEVAGKVFFGLTIVLTILGIAVLNRTLIGRWSLAPLVAALGAYHLVAILGFFSFTFGLALVFWFLAARMKFASMVAVTHTTSGELQRGVTLLRAHGVGFLFGVSAALILLFCHVFDFGIYAIMFGGFTMFQFASRQVSFRGAIYRGLELLPSAAFYLLMFNGGGHQQPNSFSFVTKLFGIVKAVSAGSVTADVAFIVGAISYVGLLLVCMRVRLSRAFLPGLIILSALYFILPNRMATGSYVDSRLPIAIVFLLIAALDLKFRESRKKTANLLIGVLVLAFTVKQVAITVLWRSFTASIDQVIESFAKLPDKAIIFTSECKPGGDTVSGVYNSRQPAMEHLASAAAFSRPMYAVGTFAIRGQQPIRVVDRYGSYEHLQADFSPTCELSQYVLRINKIQTLQRSVAERHPVFLFLIRPPEGVTVPAAARLEQKGANFSLYRVSPGA